MSTTPDLDRILADLREATKRAEEALATKREAEQPRSAEDVFEEFASQQYGRSSEDVTEEFLADPRFTRTTTDTDAKTGETEGA